MSETRRSWTREEDKAIFQLVPKIGTKKWSTVSQAMKLEYGLHGRSGKQCRQRWHNHLNPDINKRQWSKEEQNIVFQAHKKLGNKWTEISKLINGRTDNAIKNYFYSSIRRSLRRINKYLGSKNSTLKMRHIKPTVLSLIFNFPPDAKETDSEKILQQDCRSLTHALIEFSKTKIKSSGKQSVNQRQKLRLESLIIQLMIFNQNYEKILHRRKKHQLVQKKLLDGVIVKNQLYLKQRPFISSSSISSNRDIKKQEIEEEIDISCQNKENIRMIMMEESFNDWSKIKQNCQVEKQIISQNYLSIKSLCSICGQQEIQRYTPSKSQSSTIKQQYYLKYQQILECAAFE